MALPWVRLETSFPGNPKILELVSSKKWQAISVFTFSLAYSGAQNTGGFVPKSGLSLVHGSLKTARELVAVGLWEETPTGWAIHDWDEYQPNPDRKLSPSERGKRAAEARWHRGEKPAGATVTKLHA